MSGIVLGVVGASAAVGYWVVAASYLYCRLSGKLDLFVYPWDQWLEIAPNWAANGWTKAFVAVSALLAALPLVALVVGGRRLMSGRPFQVYGRTDFATQKQMAANSIATKRRPF